MIWKIQTLSAHGWADIKCSVDGAPYEPELFTSLHDALVEAENYADQCGFPTLSLYPESMLIDNYADQCGFRVVTAETPSEFDLYE